MTKKAYFILGGSILVIVFLWAFVNGEVGKNRSLDLLAVNNDELDTIPHEPNYVYHFEADSFVVHQEILKPNQFLADILLKHRISYPEIDLLVKNAKAVFDTRSMRSGHRYTVLCERDSTQRARYFVYEPNKREYVVFDFGDSIRAYKMQKQILLETREVSGVIQSSLFEALAGQKINIQVALEMANVFAWTIDFYRIQKGDFFKVIYDEEFVDGESVGVSKIHASVFNHFSSDYYAIYFENGDEKGDDYFDEKGKSLRKAFLKSPLEFGRISSAYTQKRFHPVQKRWKAHLGTDYAAPTGTPILAVGDGVVAEAQFKTYNGNYVKIKHNSTYTTQYLHMSKIGAGIKPGTRVRQGQIIGYVGSTGLATGPHVCFRFWKNGRQVDHRKEPLPPSEPVKPELLDQFEVRKNEFKQKLDNIPLPKPEINQTKREV